jgi:hypothetical protein
MPSFHGVSFHFPHSKTNFQAQAANNLRTHYWQTLSPFVNARTGAPIHGFPLNAFQVRYLSGERTSHYGETKSMLMSERTEERLRAIEWELGMGGRWSWGRQEGGVGGEEDG